MDSNVKPRSGSRFEVGQEVQIKRHVLHPPMPVQRGVVTWRGPLFPIAYVRIEDLDIEVAISDHDLELIE